MNGFASAIRPAVIQNRLLSFKRSFLFYPITFSLGSLVLFLITSRIDELAYESLTLHIPYLESLVFAGSPNAARSILSTIATGWATIVGVAFSVTLITLQLAITKYTSHIVSRFEDDKINQLTLGWFIFVVIYSLLVLKTVRTGEDTGITFTPLIGVNVAVFVAIVALFIFVLFLHNISSYLRPSRLVSGIVDRIISSMKPYQKRIPYKNILFEKSSNNNKKIYEIKSKTKGVLRHIDWNVISNNLQDLPQSYNTKNLWIEWSKSLGDWIEKDSIIATIYSNDVDSDSNKALTAIEKNPSMDDNNGKKREEEISNRSSHSIDDDDNNTTTKYTHNNGFDQEKILSAIVIGKERDISTDPVYGIEALRSLAVKSINQFDTDVVNSCITGLFRVLNDIFKSKEKIGIPFELSNDNKKKNGNKITGTRKTITVDPKESKLSEIVMLELSIIHEMAKSKDQISIIKHFLDEYISLNKSVLDENKINEFERLAGWYNNRVLNGTFEKGFHDQIISSLMDFKEELSRNYPYATDIFAIHMRDKLTSKNGNSNNNNQTYRDT